MGRMLAKGLYDQLITESLEEKLRALDGELAVVVGELDAGDADEILSRHVAEMLRHVLRSQKEEDKLQRQLEICNAVLGEIAKHGAGLDPARDRALHAVVDKLRVPPRPRHPLSTSALLVNARNEPSVGAELKAEAESADAIDLICAFVQWNGVRLLAEELRRARQRGVRIRVITTTYMGATQRRALDFLSELGAEIRIAWEKPPARTRLHAKAWLFHRASGFSTAFIGSSNLSHSAMVDGLEWNVRLSRVDAPSVLEKFRATFESYWEDEDFESYDPALDGERFDKAVRLASGGSDISFVGLDVHPLPHQREILERLDVERERHGRFRNLVVAATGTGKTVVAALDYKRLRAKLGGDPTLLFVAHRQEILEQSRGTYRAVLRDGAFGELFVGGRRPTEWRHLFASIQSLDRFDWEGIPPDHFDVVVVDEFHHGVAPTYEALLKRLQPRVLLGLTATPERADGQRIERWFDDRIAAEIRLWDALERNLLVPFHYFGVSDDVDLSRLSWQGGAYVARELQNVYNGNHARVSKVLQALREKVVDLSRIRALGFCAGVEHARFMAERFNAAGVPARAVLGDTSGEARRAAIADLRAGRISVIFAVDVFNEGVDIPEIDTVLLLRPTESVTVFLQQLGRGLRLAEGKSVLTVLDFIGQQHRSFRFDLRLRALTGRPRSRLAEDIERGMPFLPPGCHLDFDRDARDVVLRNVKEALKLNRPAMVAELRRLGDVSLRQFLQETGIELGDIYRGKGTWSRLRRAAELPTPPEGPEEEKLSRALGRLLHFDDTERLEVYRRLLSSERPTSWRGEREERLVRMLLFGLWGAASTEAVRGYWERIWAHPAIREELLELWSFLDEEAEVLPRRFELEHVPLWIRGRYSRDEILAAFGHPRPANVKEGVYYDKRTKCDLLFVTLEKTEKHYSPSTMYQDYWISPERFHWQSQSTISDTSPTGQRYIYHESRGSRVLLFVRQARKEEGVTSPYRFHGPVRYVSHEGSRPMSVIWRLG